MTTAQYAPVKLEAICRKPYCSRLNSPIVDDHKLPLVPSSLRTTARRKAAGSAFCILPRSFVVYSSGKEQTKQADPDISALNKTLQQQWDVAANAQLGRVTISKFSDQKVWWQCHQCPDGHLHRWQATLSKRSRGAGCPQCAGRKLCSHNSLARVAPKVAVFWDATKNGCTADMVLAHSGTMSHWQCHRCKYQWRTHPSAKVRSSSGCPICSRKGQRTVRQPTFSQCQHPLLAEWDHQRNAAQGLFPDKVTLRSSKKLHWLCNKCPLGQQHAWAARPAQRTAKKPSGCPFCAGQAVCKCNSLQTHFPTIAAEWDHEKNGLTPSDFTANSTSAAWWRNAERGSWQQTINSRSVSISQSVVKKQYVQDNLDG